MKIILVSLLLLGPGTAFAQNTVPSSRPTGERLRRVPTPPARSAAVPATRGGSTLPGLSHNITLAFKGAIPGTSDLDLELTGCGPLFTTDLLGPPNVDDAMPNPIVSISAHVTETEGGYHVDYTLGARIAVPTSSVQSPDGKMVRNLEFRDIMISGSALVKPDAPVILSKVAGKPLTLTISLPE